MSDLSLNPPLGGKVSGSKPIAVWLRPGNICRRGVFLRFARFPDRDEFSFLLRAHARFHACRSIFRQRGPPLQQVTNGFSYGPVMQARSDSFLARNARYLRFVSVNAVPNGEHAAVLYLTILRCLGRERFVHPNGVNRCRAYRLAFCKHLTQPTGVTVL